MGNLKIKKLEFTMQATLKMAYLRDKVDISLKQVNKNKYLYIYSLYLLILNFDIRMLYTYIRLYFINYK